MILYSNISDGYCDYISTNRGLVYLRLDDVDNFLHSPILKLIYENSNN